MTTHVSTAGHPQIIFNPQGTNQPQTTSQPPIKSQKPVGFLEDAELEQKTNTNSLSEPVANKDVSAEFLRRHARNFFKTDPQESPEEIIEIPERRSKRGRKVSKQVAKPQEVPRTQKRGQNSVSTPRVSYIFNALEDFTLIEKSLEFEKSSQNNGEESLKAAFFAPFANELNRNISSVLRRLEKLENAGNFAAFVIFFYCHHFKNILELRRIIVTDSFMELRVSSLENHYMKIPSEESTYLEFLKRAFLSPTPESHAQLSSTFSTLNSDENASEKKSALSLADNFYQLVLDILNEQASSLGSTPLPPIPKTQFSESKKSASLSKKSKQELNSVIEPKLKSKCESPKASPEDKEKKQEKIERVKTKKQKKLTIERNLSSREEELLDLVFERMAEYFKTDKDELMKSLGLYF